MITWQNTYDMMTDDTGHGLLPAVNRNLIPQYTKYLKCGGKYLKK
jgi:hypothetical protein